MSVGTTEMESQLSADLEGKYFFNRSALKDIPRRLVALEEGYDPATVARLENLGVGRGWSCLEVGAGAGSITRWLSRRVGTGGQVMAADLDKSFLGALPPRGDRKGGAYLLSLLGTTRVESAA